MEHPSYVAVVERAGENYRVASVKMRTFAKSLSAGKVPLVSWREGEGR